jgi:hypothetical protein
MRSGPRITLLALAACAVAVAACAPRAVPSGAAAADEAGVASVGVTGGAAAARHEALFGDSASARSEVLEPGVVHTVLTHPGGPWQIHLVEIDATLCRPVLEARKAAGRLSSLALTTALAADDVAGINADFFRAPGGTPVGAHVAGGEPLAGPTEWPVFAVHADGGWSYGRARLAGFVTVGGDTAALTQINREAASFTAYQGTTDGVALHTARADTLPADSAARRITLRLLHGAEAGGAGVVTAVDSPAMATYLHAGAATLLVRGGAAAWGARRAAGDTVHWQARVLVADGSGAEREAQEAVGGFPALLFGGRDVLGLQIVRRAFGDARHPRTAVGWTADGARLFLVAVDGRSEASDGMTLPELVALFRRLGASDALNLDGGGSTALVVRGRLMNTPSDDDGERAVGNALVLTRCAG